ncbi:hypothetical protein INS49_010698 [Diaporthe citri]|uniref:uncharacterized protein n=1 Tax=Diaporthe citri TaxID=83186 RepID=UPI001C80E348|nr:uncharacterized protein INS49_010698 [Diaporthe citri]KAG6362468.1 hypothetical protein INS49_010698 [Diaporthe citri]
MNGRELSSQVVDHVSALSSRIDVKKANGKCPMCQEFEVNTIRQYRSHIGHHLEQIALFALPNTDDSDGNGNENEESQENEDDDRIEDEPKGGSKSAEVDVTKIDNTDMDLIDTSTK